MEDKIMGNHCPISRKRYVAGWIM